MNAIFVAVIIDFLPQCFCLFRLHGLVPRVQVYLVIVKERDSCNIFTVKKETSQVVTHQVHAVPASATDMPQSNHIAVSTHPSAAAIANVQ